MTTGSKKNHGAAGEADGCTEDAPSDPDGYAISRWRTCAGK